MTEFVCQDCKEQNHCHRHDSWCDCDCREPAMIVIGIIALATWLAYGLYSIPRGRR